MLISVIIPCYNSEKSIHRTVQSVFNQEYEKWELILIDNNSTDNTFSILNQLKLERPESIIVSQEAIPGAPAARNRGTDLAKGEWIQFLDADDELMPGKIAHQVSLIKEHQSPPSLVAATFIQRHKRFGLHSDSLHGVHKHDIWCGLISSQLGITSANLWNKMHLQKAGGWDINQTSSQEYHLIFNLLKNGGDVLFDCEALTIIHKSFSGISKSEDTVKLTKIIDNRISLRQEIKAFLQAENILSPTRKSAIDDYIKLELQRCTPYNLSYVTSTSNKLKLNFKPRKPSFREKIRKLIYT